MATAQRREGVSGAAAPRARSADATSGWLGPLYLIAFGAALYATSLSIPFLFDDYFEIVNNPTVTVIEPLQSYLVRSRGLTALSFALNYQWSGFEVWSYHVVNVAVHLINGVLVYALVLRTLRLPRFAGRYTAHAPVLASLVGLVFLAHPLQTMAASYVIQRAESLAALFYLLTLCLFSAGAAGPPGRPRMLRYAAAAVSALLGVASKEVAATVAVTIWLYEVCFRPASRAGALAGSGRSRVWVWMRRLVMAVLILVPLLYGLNLSWHYLAPGLQPFNVDLARAWVYLPSAGLHAGVSWWQYLCTQFGVVVWYLWLFLMPIGQTFDYGWPLVDSFWRVDVIAPLLVLLALAAVALWSRRRYPLATFCLGWFFVTIAPASSIIPLRDAAFEHRMYLPLVGLSWLVVVGGYDALGRLALRRRLDRARVLRAGAALAAVWITALGAATLARNAVLADPLRLAADSAAKAPWNWRALYAFGDELAQRRRSAEAIPVLEAAVRLGPEHGSPRVRLGGLYLQTQQLDDAERVLLPATDAPEESVRAAAFSELGALYVRRGDLDAGEEAYKSARMLKPEWTNVRLQLGAIYYRKGFWYLSATHYNAAISANPKLLRRAGRAAARANLWAARSLEKGNGQHVGAAGLLRKALAYDPQLIVAQHYLAVVLASAGDWPGARAELALVASARPNDPLVQANLERARNEEPLVAPSLDGAG